MDAIAIIRQKLAQLEQNEANWQRGLHMAAGAANACRELIADMERETLREQTAALAQQAQQATETRKLTVVDATDGAAA
jgi:hypothetical protein